MLEVSLVILLLWLCADYMLCCKWRACGVPCSLLRPHTPKDLGEWDDRVLHAYDWSGITHGR